MLNNEEIYGDRFQWSLFLKKLIEDQKSMRNFGFLNGTGSVKKNTHRIGQIQMSIALN